MKAGLEYRDQPLSVSDSIHTIL